MHEHSTPASASSAAAPAERVEHCELGAGGDVLAAAARQVIDYDHAMTLGEQGVGHVAADEARTAGDADG
jgi:hypothetical protein